MMIEGFTDYPISIEEFGRGMDQPGKCAAIRAVKVLSYDGNGKVVAEVEGFRDSRFTLRASRVFAERGRMGDVRPIPAEALSSLPRTH